MCICVAHFELLEVDYLTDVVSKAAEQDQIRGKVMKLSCHV